MTAVEKEDLDYQYSPSRWSHRFEPEAAVQDHVCVTQSETDKARSQLQCELDVPYGDREGDRLDIYKPQDCRSDAPIFVYIHGGYWQFLSKDQSAFMATTLTAVGVMVVAVDYDIAPKGTLDVMVDQVRRAVSFLSEKFPSSRGLYICGHSAGGQLCAMVLSSNWSKVSDGRVPEIKGAFLVSGVYDVTPLVKTYVNEPLKMTEEDARRNSPCLFTDAVLKNHPSCKILVVFAEHDPPTFHRQSKEYTEQLKGLGMEVSCVEIPDTDHFNVVHNLAEEQYQLTKMVIAEMTS
ncbi:kynurenine formamidase-like isoform X2 [Branchiostoma floridae]|uniref:Kynurenine formamidase n=1 Tax=Branchiostoma floridae TaxID=7739 RepID=A0A9J7LK49_BRAFL|nr:kynurenine formamidase-like isoform X2 [Branchiostoma floridae]